jgi:hypothetical protein
MAGLMDDWYERHDDPRRDIVVQVNHPRSAAVGPA